ncbi:MAG: NADH-quinone oxidoreductase subunit M [Elusimicrobia bacterium]|nr:NADH-quinone oxidoreductase subunit M [Elusimicrobiota bacterium]
MNCNLLTWTVFTPMAGALAILFVPRENKGAVRTIGTAAAAVSFLISLALLAGFDTGGSASGLQFVEKWDWIPTFNIQYYLGVDGLSLPLMLLTTLLTLVSLIFSFSIEERVKEYWFWFLVLDAGMLGVFCAMDLILFYVFWELCLVPMYFLIGIWGGPKKEFAAIKFFLYTLFGSVFMLLGILALYFNTTPHTFDMIEMARQAAANPLWLPERFQILVFLAFYLAFAIKVPAFPFHTWLPLAHVEAPTAVSVILAGVLLKMGGYGLLRVSYSILPWGFKWFLPALVVIAFIGIVYGALCSMAQTDLKKMVAYSSVNHMGYCLLGIAAVNATGFSGAMLQMVAHGLITGALFLLVGVLYDRAHTRDISAFGGLGVRVPLYTGIMMTTAFASLGLPGLAGFWGEFMAFLGAFQRFPLWTILSVAGLLVTAAFFLRMIQKIFLGPLNVKWSDLQEINARELAAVLPLTALTVLIGVWPKLALDLMNPTINHMIKTLEPLFK